MCNRFDRILACDGWTDRQTSCNSIVRAKHTHRVIKINTVTHTNIHTHTHTIYKVHKVQNMTDSGWVLIMNLTYWMNSINKNIRPVLTWSASETEDLKCTHARPATVPWTVIFALHSSSVGLWNSVTGSCTTVTSRS